MTTTGHVHFYIGTYTNPPSTSTGIARLSLNTETGELTRLDDVVVQRNPSYLTTTEHGLYTFSEMDRNEGAELAFFRGSESVSLPINGDYPCHLDIKEPLLAVANYGSGNVSVFQLDRDGKPLGLLADLYVDGCGPNLERQTSPHAHQVTFLKHSHQLVVVDLGSDSVLIYDYDAQPPDFSLSQVIHLPAGSGPRHLVFNQQESTAYVVCELSETMIVLVKHQDKWLISNQTELLEGEENQQAAAAIRLSQDETFLYVSCRAQNKISVFDVSGDTPKRRAAIHCEGFFPRDFVLSHDQKWLLVANQHSNNVVSFRRNPQTGEITPTGYDCEIGSPVCIVEQPL
ncbi:lactonase family protein [Vibrio parahaemolyticus]|uniref:lactonase family protein n=1 Tax=Vibrio parahaemolyticus TaxID=670 RepID=UPI00038E54B9|nr:lactonase family protein [Vibrio parahaemolyticus]RFD43172.1 6-phosphogluconolactonase [Vibrio parahaemolyticus 3355]EGR0924212.1 lactonase family protein [Vibrio parahaemolyticus]EGR0985892.1 lactonase family protein [Vibrio parahaemolyticus]EGR1372324.1 lactonase family protein [Vibrio parahaemolyticus]EGR1374358.1 lactonase family protein [Vibrio parahaemolyticus]